MNSRTEILQKLKSLFVYEVPWDELEQADRPCPNCKSDRYYIEQGRVTTIYRCRDCRTEGGGPR